MKFKKIIKLLSFKSIFLFIKSILLSFVKLTLDKKLLYLVAVLSMGQLALSQIHIQAITKVFTRNIGMYQFMFILFGLITLFNSKKLKEGKGLFEILGSSVITIGSGVVYIYKLYTDYLANEAVTIELIQQSLILSVIVTVLYVVFVLGVLVHYKRMKTNEVKIQKQ